MSSPRLAIAAALLAVTASTLAGCSGDDGGSGSGGDPAGITDPGRDDGEDGVVEVLTVLSAGLVDGDGSQVCALMSPEAQRAIETAYDAATCIDAVGPAARSLDADAQQQLGSDASWDVSVDGEEATATGDAAGALASALKVDDLSLRRVEGRWAIG